MALVQNFKRDLSKGRRGELIALEVFRSMTDEFIFEDVAEDEKYYHIGDIKATEKATGEVIYLEIKNDACISYTRNVLCEERVYYFKKKQEKQGNMYNEGTKYYCVVSESEQKIYMLDFQQLQNCYKEYGRYRYLSYPDQASDCYLVSLDFLEKIGAVKGIIDYHY